MNPNASKLLARALTGERLRGEFFTNDYPASTMVEVTSLVHEDMLIEIEAVAVVQ